MSKFKAEVPEAIIKYLEKLEIDTEEMVGEMTTQASKLVEQNIRKNIGIAFNDPNKILTKLKITRVYENSNGAIGNRVAFYGYLPFQKGRTEFKRKGGNGKVYTTKLGVPVEFIVNVAEYGKKNRGFVRKSFDKCQIEETMKKAQEKYLPKDD